MTNFDYKAFAESMKEQAQHLVPQEFSEEDKTYLLNTLYNFALMSGEVLVKENKLDEKEQDEAEKDGKLNPSEAEQILDNSENLNPEI